jgi:hypothetical protein
MSNVSRSVAVTADLHQGHQTSDEQPAHQVIPYAGPSAKAVSENSPLEPPGGVLVRVPPPTPNKCSITAFSSHLRSGHKHPPQTWQRSVLEPVNRMSSAGNGHVETGQASLCDIVVHPIGIRYNTVTSQPIQSMRPLGDSLLSAAGLRWKCSDQKAAPPIRRLRRASSQRAVTWALG